MDKNLINRMKLGVGLTVLIIFFFIAPTQAYVLGPTTPGKWGLPVFGTGATVTWSLMPTGTTTYETFNSSDPATASSIDYLGDFMGTAGNWKHEVEAAFDAWSDVADLTFVEVTDDGADFNSNTDPDLSDSITGHGDIRIGGHQFDGSWGVLAHGYYPPANGLSAAGDIHFDTADSWVIGFPGSGFDIFTVMAHEIGHAIGLGHEDTKEITLMDPFYSEAFSGLQSDDIAGARHIYGPASVPEPSTILLIGVGLLFLISLKRRRQKPVVTV